MALRIVGSATGENEWSVFLHGMASAFTAHMALRIISAATGENEGNVLLDGMASAFTADVAGAVVGTTALAGEAGGSGGDEDADGCNHHDREHTAHLSNSNCPGVEFTGTRVRPAMTKG
jgi:hypothetical protein